MNTFFDYQELLMKNEAVQEISCDRKRIGNRHNDEKSCKKPKNIYNTSNP